MAERFDHLELPLYPETYEREKKAQGGARPTSRSEDEKGEYFDM